MNTSSNDWEPGKEGDEIKQNAPSTLPKPLRTFSYFFFGIVVLIGVVGWFASSGR